MRLRDEIDLDALRAELIAAVGTTVQPAYASLWLKRADRRDRGAPAVGHAVPGWSSARRRARRAPMLVAVTVVIGCARIKRAYESRRSEGRSSVPRGEEAWSDVGDDGVRAQAR